MEATPSQEPEPIRCDTCGDILQVGDYPFCPHGRASGFINRDEIPGGVTLENYGPTPVTFYSHSERRAYMAANGLREREKFSPTPGTDVDPQGIPNPKGYVDPYTLESGKALLLRQQKTPDSTFNPDSVLRIDDPTVLTSEQASEMREKYGRS